MHKRDSSSVEVASAANQLSVKRARLEEEEKDSTKEEREIGKGREGTESEENENAAAANYLQQHNNNKKEEEENQKEEKKQQEKQNIDELPLPTSIETTKTPTNLQSSIDHRKQHQKQQNLNQKQQKGQQIQQQLNLNQQQQQQRKQQKEQQQRHQYIRRRMSSSQRWNINNNSSISGGGGGGGGLINMRDPLGLESVRPEEPMAVAAATTNNAEKGGGGGGKILTLLEQQEQQQRNKNRKRGGQQRQDSGKEELLPPHKLHVSPVKKGSSSASKIKGRGAEAASQKSEAKRRGGGGADGEAPATAVESAAAVSDVDREALERRRRTMGERYRYGNFNFYHLKKEFRIASQQQTTPPDCLLQEDPRVELFCPDWFFEKSVLDIGCNAGHFAIKLARRFQPKRVLGLDLDQHLIGAARKNIRHFADKDAKITNKFPASFPSNFGPISAPSTSSGAHFPNNIWFSCENYVLNSDAELENVKEEFDIIFALALTKWIHLNWGDAGIRRFFQRAFRQLKTGGRFILETAPFKDYTKHCKKKGGDRPPEEVLNNFAGISFLPDEFTEFLLSTVGFSHHEELNTPQSKCLGISGRLQVFYKGKFMLTTPKWGVADEISLLQQPPPPPPPLHLPQTTPPPTAAATFEATTTSTATTTSSANGGRPPLIRFEDIL